MNASEFFQQMHRFLTCGRPPEIRCITQEHKLERNTSIHLHDGYELRMITSEDRSRLEWIDVIPPRVCHSSLFIEDKQRVHVLLITDDTVCYQNQPSPVQQFFVSPYKAQLVQALVSLANEPSSASWKEECRLLLSLFYFRAEPKENTMDIGNRIQMFAQFLQSYYYRQDLSILDTAKHFGISSGYIQHVFRERYSLNPKEYLLKVRMENAAKLISGQRYYVFEVASLCGFSDAHYFSEVFRRYYGVPPQNFSEKKKSV